MLGRFGKDAGSLLGVEIASDSVRIIQLQGCRRRHRVAACISEPLSSDGAAGDPDSVVAALENALRRCGSRQRRAALALPGSQVIFKHCQLPQGLGASGLEAQLLADAERLFPFPLDDLALDFQVLGASGERDGHQDVLVAACRQRALEPVERMVARAGLDLVAVEVDSIALRRAMPTRAEGDQALLRLEGGDAILYGWSREQVPQRHALELAPGAVGIPSSLVLQSLQVVGRQALTPDRLDALSATLGVPCHALPAMPGMTRGDGTMVLAYALALGGLH